MGKLREHRMDLGISQYELSAITGVGRYKIQCAEAGYPVLKNEEIKVLARALGFKKIPDFLLNLCISEKGKQNEQT